MADFEIKSQPEFVQKLRKLEPTDRGHADIFNAVFEKLINNDVYLEKKTEELAEELSGSTSAIINVSTTESEFIGQAVTCEGAGTETAVFSEDGTCSFKVRYLGTYTIKCMDDSVTVEVSTLGTINNVTINMAPSAIINVTTPNSDMYGQTVTCTDGSETLTSAFSESGECSFKVHNLEKYTLTCGEWSTSLYIEDLTATYDAVIQHSQTVDSLLETVESFTFVCNGVEMYGEPIVWKFIKQNHAGYPENSLLCITEKVIKIMAFDAKEPENSNVNYAAYGNERYSQSNVRQWLNSDKAGGEWYTAQHSVDAPPTNENIKDGISGYYDEAGFLHGMPKDFVDLLLDTTLRCGYHVDGNVSNNAYETVTDKVFLMSVTEVCATVPATSANTNILSGEGTPYFTDKNLGNHIGYIGTATSVAMENSGLSPTTETCLTFLRTPANQIGHTTIWGSWIYSNHCFSAYPSKAGGDTNDKGETRGIAPCINLSNTAKFSEEPNADGHYELIL